MNWCYPQSMNAPFALPSSEANDAETYGRLKLQLLEVFYRLDVAIEDWIHDGNRKAGGASTGCRLKELTEITFPQSIATKAQAARFGRLSDELDTAIKLRNLVIHSEASFGAIEGQPAIFLSPVSHSMRADGYVAVTDAKKVRAAIGLVNSCARNLAFWRIQRDNKSQVQENTIDHELTT